MKLDAHGNECLAPARLAYAVMVASRVITLANIPAVPAKHEGKQHSSFRCHLTQ